MLDGHSTKHAPPSSPNGEEACAGPSVHDAVACSLLPSSLPRLHVPHCTLFWLGLHRPRFSLTHTHTPHSDQLFPLVGPTEVLRTHSHMPWR